MKKFSVIIFLLSCVSISSQADDYIPPQLIENLNPKGISETANASRIEGWSLLSYIIDRNGVPKHIQIINSSNDDKYIEDSITYLKNHRYSPAVYKGKKTLSSQTFFMKHDKSFYDSNNDGISIGFSLRYDRAKKFIFEKKFENALEVLNKLRKSNTKNLAEQALAAWIHSIYYYHQKNWPAYRDNVLEAHQLRAHLPVDMAVKSTQNLLKWQMFKNQYSDALYTFQSLKDIKDTTFDKNSQETLLNSILDSIEMKTDIEINTTLSERKSWLHTLPRSNISLTVISGTIEFAQLRCANAWHQFKSFQIKDFNIPNDYLNCSILIKGKSGTQIKWSEKGRLRQF